MVSLFLKKYVYTIIIVFWGVFFGVRVFIVFCGVLGFFLCFGAFCAPWDDCTVCWAAKDHPAHGTVIPWGSVLRTILLMGYQENDQNSMLFA